MASRAEQLRMGRISRKMSLAPSLIMATEDGVLPDRKPTFQDYLCEHMKTIVTIIMIFTTLAVIVVVVMVHKTRFDEEQAALRDACLDIAVVGAGLSGSYAAWKLRDSPAKVDLFEMSDRVGGRFHTERLGSNPAQHVELGAMYYIPEEHPRMNRTIHALSLHPLSLPQLNRDRAITYFLRNHFLQRKFLRTSVPYELDTTEHYKYPQQLLNYYLSQILSNSSSTNFDPLTVKTKDDQLLYKQGYSSLLSRVASREGLHFLKDTTYLNSLQENHNSALLSKIPVDPPHEPFTIVEGMDQLPVLLAQQFDNSSDNHRVRKNMRLACIHYSTQQPGYKLTFLQTHTVDGQVKDKPVKVSVCARKVILAMPRQSLENIQLSAVTDPLADDSMRAVNTVPAIRVYFVYDTPWWRRSKYSGAHTVITDLPVHRVMDISGSQGYSHVDGSSDPTREQQHHVLMVSDLDGTGSEFLENAFPAETVHETNVSRYASVVRDISHHLASIYSIPVDDIPQPTAIIAKDWTKSPSGGGWDLWKRGVSWQQHALRMLKPDKWADIHVVGSSYCNGVCQFWAEGALETVDVMFNSCNI